MVRRRVQTHRKYSLWHLLMALSLISGLIVVGILLFREHEHEHDHEHHSSEVSVIQHKRRTLPVQTARRKQRTVDRSKTSSTSLSLARSCPVGWSESYGGCERTLREPVAVIEEMMDFEADTCTQPYRHACGAFLDDPDNQGENMLFYALYQGGRTQLQEIVLQQASEAPDGDVGRFYHTCVDYYEAPSNENAPALQMMLQAVDQALRVWSDLPKVMGVLARYDIPLPVAISFEIDPLRGSTLIPLISQHLGVFVNNVNELDDAVHLQAIMRIARLDPAQTVLAKRVVALERALLEMRHELPSTTTLYEYARAQYNQSGGEYVRNWAGFADAMRMQGFAIQEMLEHAWPIGTQHITEAWVYSPSYMHRFAANVRLYPVEVWRAYLRFALYSTLEGSFRVDPEHHYAYHRSYDGRWGLPWKRPHRFLMVAPKDREHTPEEQCIYATEAYLPLLVDDFYLHATLDEERLEAAQQLVEMVRDTYVGLLQGRLGNTTSLFSVHLPREQAAHKLQNMQIVIGAPQHWRELLQFPGRPSISPHSFVENVLRIRRYHRQHLEQLFADQPYRPVDADRLFDGLLNADNAFYLHQLNAVIVNAGLLQPPLFSPQFSLTSQYARLGVVLAHELSHALDRIGVQFDYEGSVLDVPWMDVNSFDHDTHYLINLYHRQSYRQNWNDGARTINENLADQYGLHVAWRALRRVNPKASLEEFRMAYAQLYCDSLDREAEQRLAARSSHSLNSVRVDAGLATFPCR